MNDSSPIERRFLEPQSGLLDEDHLVQSGELQSPILQYRSTQQYPGTASETISAEPYQKSNNSHRGLPAISLFIVSIYSTTISGIFLVIAIMQPKYGHVISNRGALSPSAATLLVAFFSKTVEISFVTLYLAFLGQTLSIRAMRQRGITLADIAMRSWVIQPGTLLTEWRTVFAAGPTILGALSLYTTVLGLLYTTASGALVQPQIRLPPSQKKVLTGEVISDYANTLTYQDLCTADWPNIADDELQATICVQIRNAGLCYRNFDRYLSQWQDSLAISPDADHRIPITGVLEDNITIHTTWIEQHDIHMDSGKAGRIVNNVTMAIPHRGIPKAVRNPRNGLLQPEDISISSSYVIEASVANPVITCLCVHAKGFELAPIIYETWPYALHNYSTFALMFEDEYVRQTGFNNETVLDDIFGWKDKSGSENFSPSMRPVFPKFPIEGNTILNTTSFGWGRSRNYLLGRSLQSARSSMDAEYMICSLESTVTSKCSTRYKSSNTLTLESLCEGDDVAEMTYKKSNESSPDFIQIPNWQEISYQLLAALNLNTGIEDGNGSLPRLLMQLQLDDSDLKPLKPTPAEALLSLSLCTYLELAGDIPFVPIWNYTLPSLDIAQSQYFNASIQIAQYMSGGIYPYEKGFIVILASVFVINAGLLFYFSIVLRIRFVADLSEPLVLFILGYHSFPEDLFTKDIQIGLRKENLQTLWIVRKRRGKLVVEDPNKSDEVELQEQL